MDATEFKFAIGLKDFKTQRIVQNMKFLGIVNGTVIGSRECEDGLYCLNQSELALSGAGLGEIEFLIESDSYHYLNNEELELTIMYRQG